MGSHLRCRISRSGVCWLCVAEPKRKRDGEAMMEGWLKGGEASL